MANGQFVNPISAGVESFQRQAGQFFRSQAEVNIFQQERERQEKEAERKTALDILKAAEAIKDPEQRVGFLRRAAALTGVTIPPEIDSELASLATNDQFMKSMKRIPDLLVGIGRERAIEATPTGRLEELAGEQRFTGVPAVQTIAPTPESQLLAGQVGSFVRRGEALPEGLREATQQFVQPPVSPEQQLSQLRKAVPTPEGGREKVTTVLEKGRPKLTREITSGGASEEVKTFTQLLLAAAGEGPFAEKAKKALDLRKKTLSQDTARLTTTILAFQATDPDPKVSGRAAKALGFLKGLREGDIVRAKAQALKIAQDRLKLDPNYAAAPSSPQNKLRLRQEFSEILESFLGLEAGTPSREGRNLSDMSVQELFDLAKEGDELAAEELQRRGEL